MSEPLPASVGEISTTVLASRLLMALAENIERFGSRDLLHYPISEGNGAVRGLLAIHLHVRDLRSGVNDAAQMVALAGVAQGQDVRSDLGTILERLQLAHEWANGEGQIGTDPTGTDPLTDQQVANTIQSGFAEHCSPLIGAIRQAGAAYLAGDVLLTRGAKTAGACAMIRLRETEVGVIYRILDHVG